MTLKDFKLFAMLIAVGWCSLSAMASAQTKPTAKPQISPTQKITLQEMEFFEKRIRPVLVKQCYSCHSEGNKQGGLLLDTRERFLKGGISGKVLEPGQPDKSLFISAMRYTHSKTKMPPAGKLPDNVIADMEKWVAMGAPDPRGAAPTESKKPADPWSAVIAVRKKWWSLQPVKAPRLPVVKNTAWSSQLIDRYLLEKLEAKGLTPSPAADKRALARRTAILLTGLPPEKSLFESFLKDSTNAAFPKFVDALLASPHYGEQWARHWMDVVRFGETHGYEWNYQLRDPWRYRDYLIRAFNKDVPYNQFVMEHIAGDLLPRPRVNTAEGINESSIGTAFYRFGEVGHDNFREIGYDVIDNQIDTLSKAFQATTLACARCHDHKLDAISSRDYYAMFGILSSSRQVIHTMDLPENNTKTVQELKKIKQDIRATLAAEWTKSAAEAGKYLAAAQKQVAQTPDAAKAAEGLNLALLHKWTVALKANDKLEEPLYPWQATAKETANLPQAWEGLKQQFQKTSKENRDFNTTNFTLLADFGTGQTEGWGFDGLGIQLGTANAGDFSIIPEGDKVLPALYPAGIYSHLISNRLNGSVRSPIFPKNKRFVSVLSVGGSDGFFRAIPDFRQFGEHPQKADAPRPKWFRFSKPDRDEKMYVDLVTKADNIRLGYNPDDQNIGTQRSYIGAIRAYAHDIGQNPKEEFRHYDKLFAMPTPQTQEEQTNRFAEILGQAVEAWSKDKATNEDALWIDTMLRHDLFNVEVKATPQLAELTTKYRETEKQLKAPKTVVGVADVGKGFDFPVFVRGDFNQHGETAPRRYLEVLCKSTDYYGSKGSGRLELAEKLASPANPLTSRVMVNRVWHHLFGEGFVRTADDFGHLGDKPSHPELMDYLSAQFMKDGWSIKKLVRSIVLTRAFQMASVPSAKSKLVDPANRLLQYYPSRRMTAESIRDTLLAVSGRLDRTLYGQSIDPHRIKPTPERQLFGGPLDGNGRRSVYTKITLMEGPAFLSSFNFPDPKSSQGRRDVTNVPIQALTMLNDPFVVEMASFWAKRLVAENDKDTSTRLTRMFDTALGRSPSSSELTQFNRFVLELQTLHGVQATDTLQNATIWKDVAHTLFNLKEFIYVR